MLCAKCGGLTGKRGVSVHLNKDLTPEQNMHLLQDAFAKVLNPELKIPEEFYCICRIG
jgi:hypothetical protein